jgi:two-component system, OmpR family, sensor histidine kinase ArlS
MTLKRKVAISLSLTYSIVFGIAALGIFQFFSDFREEEYKQRLYSKAISNAKLLLEVKEVDYQLLRLIDKNSLHQLYNEKTIIFDSSFNLLYTSIDDANFTWSQADLQLLRHQKEFFRKENDLEVLGLYYEFGESEFFILTAADDKYGKNKIQYLLMLLFVSYVISTSFVWFGSFFLTKKLLKPLDNLEKQITNITINNLQQQIETQSNDQEILLLENAFNTLLTRLKEAFSAQKDFTANASHELRTPLTRIAFQLEGIPRNLGLNDSQKVYINQILEDIYQLSEVVNNLLLLSKLESGAQNEGQADFRIDEVFFSSFNKLKRMYPDFKLNFSIQESMNVYHLIELNGIVGLFEIAVSNLLKNAYHYSQSKLAEVRIWENQTGQLCIAIENDGEVLSIEDQQKLFKPFSRGSNSIGSKGSGLGLKISSYIFNLFSAKLNYSISEKQTNCFTIIFRKNRLS